jgi:hypothetical protein
MRIRRLGIGVLSVLIACSAVAITEAKDDDKSYLPPSSVQSKTATDHQSVRQPGVRPRTKRIVRHRRHVRERYAYRRYRRERYAYRRYARQRYAYYNPGLPFPLFFLRLFN